MSDTEKEIDLTESTPREVPPVTSDNSAEDSGDNNDDPKSTEKQEETAEAVADKVAQAIAVKVAEILQEQPAKQEAKLKKDLEELNKRLKDIENKSPKIMTTSRVEGYFDYNSIANTYLNQQANDEQKRAFEIIDKIKSVY